MRVFNIFNFYQHDHHFECKQKCYTLLLCRDGQVLFFLTRYCCYRISKRHFALQDPAFMGVYLVFFNFQYTNFVNNI